MRRARRTTVLVMVAVSAAVVTCRWSAAADAAVRDAEGLFDLQGFVDNAIASGDSTIVLPPGRRRVAPTRGVHLRLNGLRGITIRADDTELICTQTTRAIDIADCRGLVISGLSIDYDPLPYTQGRIVKLSADKRVHEIEIHDGYPDASTATTAKYQVFRGGDQSLRWVDYYNPTVEALTPKRLRVTKTTRDPTSDEAVGDLIVVSSSTGEAKTAPHAVYLEACSAVRLERVTVYASNCFAFLENDCDRTVYQECRVTKRAPGDDPVPRSIPRLRSANADGFHSKRAVQGPQILGCYAHYQGDDCVNINGDYHLVAAATGERLRVIAKRSMDIQAGDSAELIERRGSVLPAAKVISVRKLGVLTRKDRGLLDSLRLHPSLKGHQRGRLGATYEVKLDRGVSLEPGSLIAASNRRGDGFTVAGCDFGDVRSRGIIIKASHGEVRDNRISRCRAESIKVAAESFWLESGYASNVRILRNTITDCGSAAIAVYATGDAGGFVSAAAHRQITISDNRVRRSPLPNIFVSSTEAVRLEGNLFRVDRAPAPIRHSLLRRIAAVESEPSAIVLHHCNEVLTRSNTTQWRLATAAANPPTPPSKPHASLRLLGATPE
ncbi:MAG: right-handed parallel beta-helix repeat-containing protein [Planctomycetota bacterium]